MIYKRALYYFLMFSCIIGCNKTNKGFELRGEITEYENNYIYLHYQDRIDSAYVQDGKFTFFGNVINPVSASLLVSGNSYPDRNFYIENSLIKIQLATEEKSLGNELKARLVRIENINGSKTDKLFTDYEVFKSNNKNKKNWKEKLLENVRNIFCQYSNNQISGNILFDISNDSILSNLELRELYNLVNWEHQDKIVQKRLKAFIFPEDFVGIGKKIYDFKLLNEKEVAVSSKQFRGSLLLLEFWASWCAPCIEDLPELSKVYEKYRVKGFNILSVSIDTDRAKWSKAIDKYNLKWNNVNTDKGYDSEIALKYKVFRIPSNFLIDKNGIVIAKDISLDSLRKLLEDNY